MKPPEVARTYDKGPPESEAAVAFVTMRPTMLCRPTTAKSAPKAAVRWRARRLVSMADTAGSDIVGGMGPPGSSTPAATPQRLPKFLTRATLRSRLAPAAARLEPAHQRAGHAEPHGDQAQAHRCAQDLRASLRVGRERGHA